MMQVWETVPEWSERRRALNGREIGFVPTMGALHRGHASLVERCRMENEVTVVSIFVNPAQFNDPQDLERYPRNLDDDLALLESLGVDEVLSPRAKDLYPCGYRFRIEEEGLTRLMEGVCRPGFFQGVMTVVLKLLNLVRPSRAYFGEKDYQQLRVIKEMTESFSFRRRSWRVPRFAKSRASRPVPEMPFFLPRERKKLPLSRRLCGRHQLARKRRRCLKARASWWSTSKNISAGVSPRPGLEGVRLIDNVPLGGCEANAPVS